MSAALWWTVEAPATVANLGPGFDALGLALGTPGDLVRARRLPAGGVRLLSVTGDGGRLPKEVGLNAASAAAQHVLNAVAPELGIEMTLEKRLPLASGLGSSGSSAAAGAVAAAAALELAPLPLDLLLAAACEGERVACGAAHADNVGPALIGGLVLIRPRPQAELIRIPVPAALQIVVVSPDIAVETSVARAVLPSTLSVADAVAQAASLGGLISAMYSGDLELLGRCAQDFFAEPARGDLIPGFPQAKQEALRAGAIGCGISGAGPSVFAWCEQSTRLAVAEALTEGSLADSGRVRLIYAGAAKALGAIEAVGVDGDPQGQ